MNPAAGYSRCRYVDAMAGRPDGHGFVCDKHSLGDAAVAATHLHVLLMPRYPGTPREYWQQRVEWPDGPRGNAEAVAATSTSFGELPRP